jgi:hypothetical protein
MLPPGQGHKKEKEAGAEHQQAEEKQVPQQTHADPAHGQKYKFQVLVDGDVHLQSLKVGHAWVRLIAPDNHVQSWGFWPKDNLNIFTALLNHPGQVRSPDITHSPTALDEHEIDGAAAERMQKAAADRKAAPGDYNLLHRNCVHFSSDMCAAAGVSIPGFSTLGIANPSKLADSIEKANAAQGHDAMDRPVLAGNPGENSAKS